MFVILSLLIFITLTLMMAESVVIQKYRQTNFRCEQRSKIKYSVFLISAVALIIISGLRSSVGDTGYYMYSYENLSSNFMDVFKNRDLGFGIYQYLIKLMFLHPQWLIIFTSAITLFLILNTLYHYSFSISFSIFLFISSGIYISTMNGMRQYLAAAIVFSATGLLLESKKWKYFLIVLLASLVHSSALIMIPSYYFVKRKAWSKSVFIISILSIFIVLNFSAVFEYFSFILGHTKYGMYVDSFGTEAYQGANILRILFASVTVIFAFLFRKDLQNKFDWYNVFSNFALLNFLIMVFSSQNWLFARVGFYFSLYNLLLLPAVFYNCIEKKERLLLTYVMGCFYLLFFYFDMRPHIYASFFLNINRELIGPLTRTFYSW